MESKNRLSSQRLPVILAAVGLLFSGVLAVEHYRAFSTSDGSSFCSVGETFDCVRVAVSAESIFLDVPLPVWGLAGFVGILAAALRRSAWLVILTGIASLGSLALLAVAIFRLGTICLLCEVVHLTSWLLFAIAWVQRKSLDRKLGNPTTLYFAVFTPALFVTASRLFVPNYWDAFTYRSTIPFATGTTGDGFPWIGSKNPKITVHEFVDYACPHCKAKTAFTLRSLARHPELRIVRRQAPRQRCVVESACVPLRLWLCASELGKPFEADRYLFAHFSPRATIAPRKFAHDMNLDEEKIETCFRSKETFEKADALSVDANRAHVIETPTYFRDGKKLRPKQFEVLFE